MRITALLSFTIGIFCVTAYHSASYAATWRCEEKTSAGFHTDSGYQLREYRTNKYIISTEVYQEQFNEFSWDMKNWSDYLKPAGLTMVGDDARYLLLCTHSELKNESVNYNIIKCENHPYFEQLEFNLHTGLFTAVNMDFGSSYGGSSSVRVGECVRTD